MMSPLQLLAAVASRCLILMVRTYQAILSPLLGGDMPFHPFV